MSRVNHRAELADPLLQAVRRARAAALVAGEEAELALWEALESGRSVAAVARAFDVRPRAVADRRRAAVGGVEPHYSRRRQAQLRVTDASTPDST